MVCSILFTWVLVFSFTAFPFLATVAHVSWPTARTPGWLSASVSPLVFGQVVVCLLLVWGSLFALVASEGVSLLRACA
jgi:hypothetical protein